MTFHVGIYRPNTTEPAHRLARAAASLGAAGFFTVGPSQITRTDIPVRHFMSVQEARSYLPAYPWIAVEVDVRAESLDTFTHPVDAIYLFGDQNGTIPREVLRDMAGVVEVDTDGPGFLDVAVAGGIVLHDRLVKHSRVGL